jgi:glycerate 2-kinase
MKETAEKIFLAGVEHVMPDKLIRAQVCISDDVLSICGEEFNLRDIQQIYVIGAGKASALMAQETERILGERISEGHVITKYGHGCKLQHINLHEAAHPVPDENGVNAARKIIEIAKKATEHDLVICLISGGASALFADIPEDISLDDLCITNKLLVTSGATIVEINTIRKHLSEIKGGQLARLIHPATCVSLILSDVVNDPIDVIASGPTAPDESSYADAYAIVKKHKLDKLLPHAVTQRLLLGNAGVIPETPGAFHPCFQSVRNKIIGSNTIALNAAATYAKQAGFTTHIITDSIQEEYSRVANFIIQTTEQFQSKNPNDRPLCLLFGGEPTVQVQGDGMGGRNQHLALYLATQLTKKPGLTILCAGTDGSDGPTDAAGAVVDSTTVKMAQSKGIDANQHLKESDSYHFFRKAGGHIITGSTQTNVMDIIVVLSN